VIAEAMADALPDELIRSRKIRRAGIGFSAAVLLVGSVAAAADGLLLSPLAAITQVAAATAATFTVALAGAKAVLGVQRMDVTMLPDRLQGLACL
jgi:hypothetical protein